MLLLALTVRIAGITQGDVERLRMHEAHQRVVHEDAGPALLVALVVRVLFQVAHVVTKAVGLVVQRHGCLGVELQLLQVG